MKNIATLMLLTLALTGCRNLNDQSIYEVDFEHLVRSAFYTQQALLQLHLTYMVETNTPRYRLLIASYCDLIDRGYINVSEKPKQCPYHTINLASANEKMDGILKNETNHRLCVTIFHRCFNNCSLRNNECISCEERGIRCLNQTSSYQMTQ